MADFIVKSRKKKDYT